MNIKNEKGVTLVELLAVLVLVSMVATIILTTFFIATKYNITETKKLKMQQEANYIITKVLQKHRTTDSCYNLNVVDESGNVVAKGKKIIFSDCSEPSVIGVEVVIADSFMYTLTEPKNEIHPKLGNFKTTVKIIDPKNSKLYVSVDTEFGRYTN